MPRPSTPCCKRIVQSPLDTPEHGKHRVGSSRFDLFDLLKHCGVCDPIEFFRLIGAARDGEHSAAAVARLDVRCEFLESFHQTRVELDRGSSKGRRRIVNVPGARRHDSSSGSTRISGIVSIHQQHPTRTASTVQRQRSTHDATPPTTTMSYEPIAPPVSVEAARSLAPTSRREGAGPVQRKRLHLGGRQPVAKTRIAHSTKAVECASGSPNALRQPSPETGPRLLDEQ